MRVHCPTPGFAVRSDKWGDGAFGTPRGTLPDGSKKFHDGLDLMVVPGDIVVSMIDGDVEKVDYPYGGDLSWKGIQIANDLVRVELWYMEPYEWLIGKFVEAGEPVGNAQDISMKYRDPQKVAKLGFMIPHIHVRVTLRGFTTLVKGKYFQGEITVDPRLLIGGV